MKRRRFRAEQPLEIVRQGEKRPTSVDQTSNNVVATEIVEPHEHVKLVLGGHIAVMSVAINVNRSGRRAHGVLTDYQSRVYGGQEYMNT